MTGLLQLKVINLPLACKQESGFAKRPLPFGDILLAHDLPERGENTEEGRLSPKLDLFN
jgi:hypothetical protein